MDISKNQQGNALFLILIAVILFAALSYAITQSSRGGAAPKSEKLEILYGQYANVMAAAQTEFMRMRLSGCSLEDIPEFSTDSASAKAQCNFYSTQEGAFPYRSPITPADREIYLYPVSVLGIGQNDRQDILLTIHFVDNSASAALCDYINQKNGIIYTNDTSDSYIESSSGGWFEDNFSQNVPTTFPAAFSGKAQDCVFDASMYDYAMYQVIETH